MTTDTHAALLEAVCREPGDTAVRLALADWLDEHGDDADRTRAEFIRVQCEINAIPGDPDCPHPLDDLAALERKRLLRHRENELLNGVCGLGVEALPVAEGLTRCNFVGRGGYGWYARGDARPQSGIQAVFRRGFVEEVRLSCADWMRRGPALVRAAPLTTVVLAGKEPYDLAQDEQPGMWCWSCSDDPDAPPWRLPECIAAHLDPKPRQWHYHSRQLALDALSAAALAWARATDPDALE